MDNSIDLLLRMIDEAFDRKSWHGTNLRGSLRDAVAQLAPKVLAGPADGGTTTTLSLVTGIAAHDVYHAGQIQLIKRLHSDHVS